MKNKFLIGLIAMATTLSVMADSSAPQYRALPLLSGYNVLLANTNVAYGLGSIGVLYTKYNGQVVYSITNNIIIGSVGGTSVTNPQPDAFQAATLTADANGDQLNYPAFQLIMGSTNWIPTYTTNQNGQYIVLAGNYTNAQYVTAGGWPLAPGGGVPNWMLTATTNTYPAAALGAGATNNITLSFYRSVSMNPQGGFGPDLQATGPTMWETAPGWTTNITWLSGQTVGSPSQAWSFIGGLPTNFQNGAKHVYVTITLNAVTSGGINGIVNQLFLIQAQP